jgi:hypothetical protein
MVPDEYHGLVLSVPACGTVSTNVWYCSYQRMVLLVPTCGTRMVKMWYSGDLRLMMPVLARGEVMKG